MRNPGYQQNATRTLVVVLVCLPFLCWSSQLCLRSMRNLPVRWLSPEFPQRRDFDEFITQFQTLGSIVISWPGCTVDDPRLRQLEAALTSDEAAASGESLQSVIADVHDGYSAVRELMQPPLQLSRRQAVHRLLHTLVGPDGETSCAVIALTPHGDDLRGKALEIILNVAEREVGLPRQDFHLAGDLVEGVAIDAEAHRANAFALPSALMSLALCALCLRSLRMTGAILIVAVFGEVLVLSTVWILGIEMNAVFSIMAPLVFVLTISAGVHLANYYFDEVRARGIEGATRRALRDGWAPCILATVTTAIGLGSLVISDIVPIRQFGVITAVGLIITTMLLFLLLPGAMSSEGRSPRRAESRWLSHSLPRVWSRLARGISRTPGLLATAGIAAMLAAGLGLQHVKTSVNVRDLFVFESRVLRDYRWLEESIGPLVPVEVVLHFDSACEWSLLERVQFVRDVEHSLGTIEELGGISSASTFLPTIPAGGGARQAIRRAVIRRRIDEQREPLRQGHWLCETAQAQSWRISARVAALGDIDYGTFLQRVRSEIEPLLRPVRADGVSVTCTGLTPVVYAAQRALLNNLIASFLTALALVSIIFMLVQRSLLAGLLAMVPNVFPSLILLGVMGWLKLKVDIGTVMTASIALGIAVDDTLHFLIWYRRERKAGKSPAAAIERTYGHCGLAMMQTTIICGLGLLIFALSGFVPTRRFAWVISALLMAALLGDLVLLPAVLLSPVGRLLDYRTSSVPKRSEVATSN